MSRRDDRSETSAMIAPGWETRARPAAAPRGLSAVPMHRWQSPSRSIGPALASRTPGGTARRRGSRRSSTSSKGPGRTGCDSLPSSLPWSLSSGKAQGSTRRSRPTTSGSPIMPISSRKVFAEFSGAQGEETARLGNSVSLPRQVQTTAAIRRL